MLILARRAGEAIAIDNEIIVRVLEVKNGQVRLGVEAPDHVTVHREEIYLRILEENRKAASPAPGDLSALDSVLGSENRGPATEKK